MANILISALKHTYIHTYVYVPAAGKNTENGTNSTSNNVIGISASPLPFRPHCMFNSTPLGCVKTRLGGVCCAWHDDEYTLSVKGLINEMAIPQAKKVRNTMGK